MLPKFHIIDYPTWDWADQSLDYLALFSYWYKCTVVAHAIGAVLNQVIFSGYWEGYALFGFWFRGQVFLVWGKFHFFNFWFEIKYGFGEFSVFVAVGYGVWDLVRYSFIYDR
jgi:hypothetical protein